LTGARKLMDWILTNAALSKPGRPSDRVGQRRGPALCSEAERALSELAARCRGLDSTLEDVSPHRQRHHAKPGFHVYTDLELTGAQLELMRSFPDRFRLFHALADQPEQSVPARWNAASRHMHGDRRMGRVLEFSAERREVLGNLRTCLPDPADAFDAGEPG